MNSVSSQRKNRRRRQRTLEAHRQTQLAALAAWAVHHADNDEREPPAAVS